MTVLALLPLGVFIVTVVLTGRFRQYALNSALLDVPNARSSHTIPTPRGGGVVIVFTTTTAILLAGYLDALLWPSVLAFAGAGMIVAVVGFVDDRRGLSAHWRLLGHFASACWLLYWLGGVPPVLPAANDEAIRKALGVVAILGIVWLTNLTNFMDGIDGIAASEIVTVSIGGWALALLTRPELGFWPLPLLLAAAALGFLVWNWPPAKIFMGDSGSGFFGLCLAGLALQAGWMAAPLFWAVMVLLGTFVVDATVTLFRRIVRGRTFYHAHCTHAYQHAAQRFGGHRQVTLWVWAINVVWLFPIAYLAASGVLPGPAAVTLAYTPLALLAFWFDAGVEVVAS